MNSTLSQQQNVQEAELAIDQLAEHIGQGSFRKQFYRTEELLKALHLEPEVKEPLQERLSKIQAEQESMMAEVSGKIRQEVMEQLETARESLTLPEGELGEIWETAKTHFQDVQNKLELARTQLDMERRRLTREHQDECWAVFKQLRKELKKGRNELSQRLKETADQLYAEAETAVNEHKMLREAREVFKTRQKEVNHLPLRREQRKDFHTRFNQLWEVLQERSKQHRAERKQRQAEGLQKLEEALNRVEAFIAAREADLKVSQERLQETHWNEVDRLEKQVTRDERELEDARRRQGEIQAKIEDARARLARMS